MKAVLRSLLPRRHYRHLWWYRQQFGLKASLGGYLRLLTSRDGLAPMAVPGTSHRVHLRPGTSDEFVFGEIFVDKEYDLELGDPLVIVDAGAHIGLGSIFFAIRYPRATIIAVEPEEANFALLKRNVAAFPNIRALQAALWSRDTVVKIGNPDADTWAFQVGEGAEGRDIPTVTMEGVFSMFGIDRIHVFKVDIEGAEKEVFRSSADWIDKVDCLIVELHDRFQPGCTEALDEATRGHTYERSTSGESVVLRLVGDTTPHPA